MKPHPADLVARVKGALRVLRPKQISYLTGISANTIMKWGREELQANVAADETVGQDIRDVLMGRFLGDPKRR